jgi:predicted metal-dependent phosphoesterase TrpH
MHSTASDGSFTPEALMRHAGQRDLKTVALTDHDTVDGLAAARRFAEQLDIEFIDGIEISAQFEPGTMHVLGYFLDPHSKPLLEMLAGLQNARGERNPEIIRKLQAAGIDITYEEVVKASGGGQVGRPHFAKVLVEKGVVRSYEEAFEKFLKKGAAAYVDKRRLSPEESVKTIAEAGGVPVLAHPKQLKVGYDEAGVLFERLKASGLGGLEVYHSSHNRTEAKHFRQLAEKLDLIVTGGSDFHGASKKYAELGMLANGHTLEREVVDALRKRAQKC